MSNLFELSDERIEELASIFMDIAHRAKTNEDVVTAIAYYEGLTLEERIAMTWGAARSLTMKGVI
jgi:hypothetical protein